jgi:hypothetical protein
MAILLVLSLGTLAALWLPQRSALSVANVLIVIALLGMFIRRRR